MPERVELGHGLERDDERVEHDLLPLGRRRANVECALHLGAIVLKVRAKVVVDVPEEKAEHVVDEADEIETFLEFVAFDECHIFG